MQHHFTLTFRVPENESVRVDQVASKISGSDFQVEAPEYNPAGEFSVHFVRSGNHATELLEFARNQVEVAIPGASLVSMDMSEEPPMLGMVDDIAKLVIRACQLLESPDAAQRWLSTPNESLGGITPKAAMVDAEGRTQVSRALAAKETVAR